MHIFRINAQRFRIPGASVEYTNRIVLRDGRALPITTNVSDALARLASPQSKGAARAYLWIDQICVGQQSDVEKSRQIPLLKDIFHKAELVMVWFSPFTEDTDIALALLDGLKVTSLEYGSISIDEKQEKLPPAGQEGDMLWDALEGFFNRPRITRIWVRQEVGVGFSCVCSLRR